MRSHLKQSNKQKTKTKIVLYHNYYTSKCIGIPDIFKFGFWSELKKNTEQNIQLRNLTDELPDIILKSRSVNTRKSYESHFKRWIQWCKSMNIEQTFPALDFHVALFLGYLIQNGSSVSVIEGVYYSIKWLHDMSDTKNPCDTKIVSFMLDAARKTCGAPVQKKKPITADMIVKLFEMYPLTSINLYHLRSLVMFILGFAGFLRISELINLRNTDIEFEETHIKLNIRSSKTDQCNAAQTVIIAKTEKLTCPFNVLKLYMDRAGLNNSTETCIFKAFNFNKNNKVFKLRKTGNLSYTRCRELIREKITDLGLNPNDYGTHSLRRGGATASAMNNISDRLLKKHGRWKSDKAKDGYIFESEKQKLSVSANLGI